MILDSWTLWFWWCLNGNAFSFCSNLKIRSMFYFLLFIFSISYIILFIIMHIILTFQPLRFDYVWGLWLLQGLLSFSALNRFSQNIDHKTDANLVPCEKYIVWDVRELVNDRIKSTYWPDITPWLCKHQNQLFYWKTDQIRRFKCLPNDLFNRGNHYSWTREYL